MPAPSRHAHFVHTRTVRLHVPEEMYVDVPLIMASLPEFAKDITGIVPQYGGKIVDITVNSTETASKLAQAGFDYEQKSYPLVLRGPKTIHISAFVDVEFPDAKLIGILKGYGTLQTDAVRRVMFKNDPLRHVETGTRVVVFSKLERDIPRRIIAEGLPIGFKYTGQPETCFRCGSPDHKVKECPKARRAQKPTVTEDLTAPATTSPIAVTRDSPPPPAFPPPPPPLSPIRAPPGFSLPEVSMPEPMTQELFDTDSDVDTSLQLSRKRKTMQSPSSDDENSDFKKANTATADSDSDSDNDDDANDSTPVQTSDNTPEKSGRFKMFLEAVSNHGPLRTKLMETIQAQQYYKCRGLYLQYKYGDRTDTIAKQNKLNNSNDKCYWNSEKGKIKQDAFGELLGLFQEFKREHNLFHD